MNAFSDRFEKQLKSCPRLPIRQKRWQRKTLGMLHDFLNHETVISIHNSMNQQDIEEFEAELEEFLRHVRTFAPELSFEEIGQAIRNYIVYKMFKEIHQVTTGFSIAGFGYSMLYPFTDNYIDSDDFTSEEKEEYNRIIRDTIAGADVHPKSAYQQKTYELLKDIESEYPREKDTAIYTLLNMMLNAQEDSIRQQHKGTPLTAEERLDISLYKGGISVLIDRYLVGRELTENEIVFYLGMGFFLQLADDLQDIKTDSRQGYQTLLTLNLFFEQEEKIVNKMLSFIHHIMTAYHAENDTFKNFILSNCYLLVFTSIGESREFFSQQYLDRAEKHLPVTYAFLEDRQKNLISNQDKKMQEQYINLLDHFISN